MHCSVAPTSCVCILQPTFKQNHTITNDSCGAISYAIQILASTQLLPSTPRLIHQIQEGAKFYLSCQRRSTSRSTLYQTRYARGALSESAGWNVPCNNSSRSTRQTSHSPSTGTRSTLVHPTVQSSRNWTGTRRNLALLASNKSSRT